MAVTTQTNRWAYTGDGTTTAFAYDNRIFAAGDLRVWLDGVLQTLTTHYSVSGVGVPGGGTVTFGTAPGAGAAVLIVAAIPATQETVFPRNDPFATVAAERGFDRTTRLAQQLADRLDGTVRTPLTETIAEIPKAADRASTLLGFDASGAPQVYAPATSVAGAMPDGTAAAPGLPFADDPDTGLYRVDDNKGGLVAAGKPVATWGGPANAVDYWDWGTAPGGTPTVFLRPLGESTNVRGQLRNRSGNTPIQWDNSGVGFINTAPVGRQSITGATDSDKIASIIAGLVAFGLFSDNTS